MSSGKINEFKALLQKYIEANGESVFGNRIHWKNFPDKIRANSIKALNIPDGETILMLFDGSLMGSGKEGMAFTNRGIRYNNDADSWNLTWNDLQEKYTLVKVIEDEDSSEFDALLLKAKSYDDFAVDKRIHIPMVDMNYNLMASLLNKSCQIFTGKNINTQELPMEQQQETDETPEEDDEEDKMKYRVFNYGIGNVPLPSRDPTDEIQEFQLYLKKVIDEIDTDRILSRCITRSSSEISDLEAKYLVETSIVEKIAFFFDLSPHKDRDYGIALTNFGIIYKFYGELKEMPWKELAEKYAIRVNLGIEIVEPDSVLDEDADPVMEINFSQTDIATSEIGWVLDIICIGCEIFTGIKGASQNVDSKEKIEQIVNTTGSIIKRNPEGVIMSIIASIITFSAGPSVLGFLLSPIFSFLGYIVGNKIRFALHPDFVMASGAYDLFKQKVFWRFVPQLIGALIGAGLGSGIGAALF